MTECQRETSRIVKRNRSNAERITVLCNLSSITSVPLTHCTPALGMLHRVVNIACMYVQDLPQSVLLLTTDSSVTTSP